MNKSFLISILLLFGVINVSAQENLVPNPSFEVADSCGEFYYFLQDGFGGWFAPTPGTSDMYNGCTTDEPNSDVPHNYVGWQYARTGIGYAGLISYETSWTNPEIVDAREYVAIKLKKPLIENRKYQASFYASLADFYSTCASNYLGMYFSEDSIFSSIPWDLLDYPAQVESNETIEDSINWTKIEGIFEADGGELFLTIGCFRDDSQLDVVSFTETPLVCSSYYYIDDVSIVLLPLEYECVTPNIFTPNHDGNNDYFQLQTIDYVSANIKIFNRWGNLVYRSENINFKWDGSGNSEGTYYYIICLQKEDNNYDIKTGYVQLIR